MKQFQPSPLGVLKCNDLVELYYGLPLRTVIIESFFDLTHPATAQLLLPDPRRIHYEITFAAGGGVTSLVSIGSSLAVVATVAEPISTPVGGTVILVRDWRSELDAVTLPLFVGANVSETIIGVRQVILTPPGVDVIPLPG